MGQPQAIQRPQETPHPSHSEFRAVRRLLRHKGAVVGGTIVLILLAAAIFAPVLAPYHPIEDAELVNQLKPPSAQHWMGTDEQGRDILSRIIWGSRLSLMVSVVSVGISLVTGVVIGSLAAYYGGWWDLAVMRLIDIMLAFPSVLLAIAMVAMMGPSLMNAMIAVGIINMPIFARLIRSSVLAIKETEYVEAARALGMANLRIIGRHILPNSLAPLMVQATLSFGTAILETAALSFLGLGAQPPTPEWGAMLSNAQTYIQLASWVVTFPGLAIMFNVLGFNLLGDGLRDVLDPRLRNL